MIADVTRFIRLLRRISFHLFIKVAIWNSLNFYAFEDATFLAERLCSEGECEHMEDKRVFT